MVKGKNIVIIAGTNGTGKTTFAKEFLPNEADCPIFVNADLIAAFNFQHIYKQLVDTWILYDNSGRIPKLLEKGEKK